MDHDQLASQEAVIQGPLNIIYKEKSNFKSLKSCKCLKNLRPGVKKFETVSASRPPDKSV